MNEKDEESFERFWGVIAAGIMVVVIAGLLFKFVAWVLS